MVRCQFHQHFTRKFFVRKFVQSQTLSREKLPKRLWYKKGARKMLMKLTPECLGRSPSQSVFPFNKFRTQKKFFAPHCFSFLLFLFDFSVSFFYQLSFFFSFLNKIAWKRINFEIYMLSKECLVVIVCNFCIICIPMTRFYVPCLFTFVTKSSDLLFSQVSYFLHIVSFKFKVKCNI